MPYLGCVNGSFIYCWTLLFCNWPGWTFSCQIMVNRGDSLITEKLVRTQRQRETRQTLYQYQLMASLSCYDLYVTCVRRWTFPNKYRYLSLMFWKKGYFEDFEEKENLQGPSKRQRNIKSNNDTQKLDRLVDDRLSTSSQIPTSHCHKLLIYGSKCLWNCDKKN